MNDFPRLRMFAGPNGSGKSTIKGSTEPAMLIHL
jgi:predicted ABC-type ATPase